MDSRYTRGRARSTRVPAPANALPDTDSGRSLPHCRERGARLGVSRFGRYRILPLAGNEYLDDGAAAGLGANFLIDEIQQRVGSNPVTFRIAVQLAEAGDETDDATVRWPEIRPQTAFGELTITAVALNNAAEQRHIIFDPIPRVDGIDASADPLFEPRANVYLISGRRRRTADTAAGA